MRFWTSSLAVLALVWSGVAQAAPVARPVDVNLTLVITGLAPITLDGGGSVTIDDEAETLQLPAGLLTLATPVSVPVTTTTAVNAVTATVLSNQSGTVSPGGAAFNTTTEPACTASAPLSNAGCVPQTGIGGPVGLTGVVNVVVFPGFSIGVNLDDAKLGQGGTTTAPFLIDAAPWTTLTGVVKVTTGISEDQTETTTQFTTGTGALTANGATNTGSSFTLVTPTFISALGNVLPIFTRAEISFTDGNGLGFIPEPGVLLALGSVLGALALMRRS